MPSLDSDELQRSLQHFHPTLRRWFLEAFDAPTPAQTQAWPLIARGANTLLLAPTGSGKTLAAFLTAIHRIMFPSAAAPCSPAKGVRVLYISPLKALGVDVERNLRSPIVGVRAAAEREGVDFRTPRVGVRSGDTPSAERHRLNREPPDILITTPESLYLILTSRARDTLGTVEAGLQLAQLSRLGVVSRQWRAVRDYLERFPDLAAVLPAVCEQARRQLPPPDELAIEVYRDPEISDEYLTLYIRQPRNEADLMERIERLS